MFTSLTRLKKHGPNGEVTPSDSAQTARAEPAADRVRLKRKPPRLQLAAPVSAADSLSKPDRFELCSTVRYRVDGHTHTGIVIGISHGESLRYDIRRPFNANGKSKRPPRVSFGVPHKDVEKLIEPPPNTQKIIVLSELPPEPPAPVGQGGSRPGYKRLLAQLFGTEQRS